MSVPPLTPYTGTTRRNSRQFGPIYDHVIELDGKRFATASNEDSSWGSHWTKLLNDAFAKGVETECASCVNATAALPAPHGLNAARLINLTAPDPDRAAPQPPIYLIAEREPEFDRLTGMCWMWGTVGINVPHWMRLAATEYPAVSDLCSHWSPDDPRPPSINPSST